MNTLRETREQSHLCVHTCMHAYVCVCVEFERDGSLDKEKREDRFAVGVIYLIV